MDVSSTMKPAIALIGCGMWGRNIARNLSALGLLCGVGDRKPEAARDFASQFSCDALTPDEIINADHIDGVAIVTAAPSHAELAIAALDQGKAVFVEKPLALNVDEAETMAAAARRRNAVLMVGHLIRHHPVFQHMLTMIDAGDIGRLLHIRSSRLAPGRVRDTETVLYDLCPHDLALVAALTGREDPSRVQCHGLSHITPGVEDSVTAQLDFRNGVTASIQANWMNPVKVHNLTVIGSKAALVFDDTRPWAEKLMRFGFAVDRNEDGPLLHRGDPEAVAVPESEPLKAEMQRFAAAITDAADPLSGIDEALYVQHIMARMQAAMEKGKAM